MACIEWEDDDGETFRPLPAFLEAVDALQGALVPFLKISAQDRPACRAPRGVQGGAEAVRRERRAIPNPRRQGAGAVGADAGHQPPVSTSWWSGSPRWPRPVDELAGQADRLYKLAVSLVETCEKEYDAKSSDAWNGRDITRARKAADEVRQDLTKQDESLSVQAWGQLRKVRYFWRQARWLTERFPGAELCDVEGLVKLVDRAEIEANDWSLTPGRYVGVAPEEEDEDFDFGEAMRAIHAELEDLNAEAATLATTIRKNFEALGI